MRIYINNNQKLEEEAEKVYKLDISEIKDLDIKLNLKVEKF